MRNLKHSILIVIAVLALVSVASAVPPEITLNSLTWLNDPDSYFRVVTATGDFEVPPGGYDAMCLEVNTLGGQLDGGMTWKAWDSRLYYDDVSGLPPEVQTMNYHILNWVANNPHADWRITQAVVWKLDGQAWANYPGWLSGAIAGYNKAAYDIYWAEAQTHTDYAPSEPGEYFVVILTKQYINEEQESVAAQPMALRVPIRDIPSPEFPSLALPIAMLIGMVGVVGFVRMKKE
jgi:hypothetical protein